MNEHLSEVLASIQALTRQINIEFGVYATYSERHSGGATSIRVSIGTGHNGEEYTFHVVEGSDGNGSPGSLERARDELADYLVEMRRKAA